MSSKNLKTGGNYSSVADFGGDALLRWLSVAESQVCALRVIVEQLPEMKALLEDNMEALSEGFNVLASETSGQGESVEKIVQLASKIDVSEEELPIKEALNKALSGGNVRGDVQNIVNAMEAREGDLSTAIEDNKEAVSKMMGSISSVIVGMQFQDRISQNIVIIEKVCKEMMLYMDEVMKDTSSAAGLNLSRAQLDVDFAKRIVAFFTLGELQRKFVNNLIDDGHLKEASEIGLSKDIHEVSDGDDDLELF